jgi:hypothetical protein
VPSQRLVSSICRSLPCMPDGGGESYSGLCVPVINGVIQDMLLVLRKDG